MREPCWSPHHSTAYFHSVRLLAPRCETMLPDRVLCGCHAPGPPCHALSCCSHCATTALLSSAPAAAAPRRTPSCELAAVATKLPSWAKGTQQPPGPATQHNVLWPSPGPGQAAHIVQCGPAPLTGWSGAGRGTGAGRGAGPALARPPARPGTAVPPCQQRPEQSCGCCCRSCSYITPSTWSPAPARPHSYQC